MIIIIMSFQSMLKRNVGKLPVQIIEQGCVGHTVQVFKQIRSTDKHTAWEIKLQHAAYISHALNVQKTANKLLK